MDPPYGNQHGAVGPTGRPCFFCGRVLAPTASSGILDFDKRFRGKKGGSQKILGAFVEPSEAGRSWQMPGGARYREIVFPSSTLPANQGPGLLISAGSRRPVGAKRARTHAHPGSQWRRHPMERDSTVATQIRMSMIHAKPMATRLTFGIDALHRPAGKVLHAAPSGFSVPCRATRKSWRDCVARGLWCQAQSYN